MTDFIATCRGLRCGKRIVMVADAKGRPHPYDLPVKRCGDCGGRKEIIRTVTDLLGERTERVPCKRCKGAGRLLVSHFSTCVDADVFRGKAEA